MGTSVNVHAHAGSGAPRRATPRRPAPTTAPADTPAVRRRSEGRARATGVAGVARAAAAGSPRSSVQRDVGLRDRRADLVEGVRHPATASATVSSPPAGDTGAAVAAGPDLARAGLGPEPARTARAALPARVAVTAATVTVLSSTVRGESTAKMPKEPPPAPPP